MIGAYRFLIRSFSFAAYSLWITAGCLFTNRVALCQEINLRFQHITSDQGLSQNTVDCILHDSHGFIWFGTWNGLNRFDGYNFTVFKSAGKGDNLSNNFIYSVCEDKNGDIWAGTKDGLNKLVYSTGKFIRYYHDPGYEKSIAGNAINQVYCDRKGILWVGTADKGLDQLVFDKDYKKIIKIVHYRNDSRNPYSSPGNEINVILEDHNGNIWVGTNNGLGRLDQHTQKFSSYRNSPEDANSISYNRVLAIYEDHLGYIWVGTSYGLNRFNPSTGIFTRFYTNPDDSHSLSHFTVKAITEDAEGNLLVGTLGGLNRFNRERNEFYRFPINQNDDYSLNNEFINSILADKQGNVWIGTDKGGINKYNVFQKQFGYFVHDPANKNTISHNTINSVLEEPSFLWIGTAGGGLNRYERATRTFKCFKSDSHQQSCINNDFITSFCRDRKQNLWIGTWGGGLNKLLSASGKGSFKKFVSGQAPNSICSVFVSSLYEDEKGFILIGTVDGLDLFYPEKETFLHVANNVGMKKRISEVGCLLKDTKDNYWIGTRLGLFRLPSRLLEKELTDEDIARFTNRNDDPNSLPGNYIISLYQDHRGNLWVGTYGNGISRLSFTSDEKPQFTNYSEKDGLCNNVIYAIQEDDHGYLWLSTDNGLSRFDPDKKNFRNYTTTDGLQSNQFYWSAAFKSKEGRMYFGGVKGLNFFYPDSISKDNQWKPKVAITDFKIFNNSVNIGLWNRKRVVLDKVISETSKIKLTYKENVFSFEFSALDYFLPEKVQYQYKMEGVDNDWVTVPASRRFVTYTNLKGGDYTFVVKATNSDGVWGDKPTLLKIHISPPFWATWWFKCIVLVILSFLILAYFRFRTLRLETQKQILEILVKERTAKIEEQKEELKVQAEHLLDTNHQLAIRQELIEGQKEQLEKQNQEISDQRDKLIDLNKRVQIANQLKLRFFTNISHEFRTPLTLILGPLDKLLSNWKGDAESLSALQLISRNAQRLLHLINQLMEFRKIETGKLELKVSEGDLVKFLENIYSSFQQLAVQKEILYSFHPVLIREDQWFDHEKIENVLYNLLSNAFKFTHEKGKISLSMAVVEKQLHFSDDNGEKHTKSQSASAYIEIKVKDTGIGIPQEHIGDIFKRFFQVNSPDGLKVRGSGIGLSLTKELVKAHKGVIFVESTKGEGSVFTVRIPFRKSDFSEKELTGDTFVTRDNIQEQVSRLTEEFIAEKESAKRREADLIDDHNEKPLILVVEDNFDLRSFISASLSGDFNVIETENGKEAYEMAKIHNPELIVSDIMMPEMDGLELCSRLKNNLLTSHITVILLTARSSVEHWIEGLETGADDYIPKPFDITILNARIKNLIETRRKLRKHFSRELIPDFSKIITTPADEQFMKKACEVVEENFADPTFGVEEFVNKMCISHSLLHKKLSAIADQSAGDFITSVRLKKAAQLLHLPDKNISEVAYDVGFNDPKYFSRIFKKYFGRTPSEYVSN